MRLLDIARAELGTKESPVSSNRVKYAAWYGMDGQPWCVMYVQWVFDQAGVEIPRTASCTELRRQAIKQGAWVTGDYKPGDVVIYDWGGDNRPDHCGIVEGIDADGDVIAIEGNTAMGNDSNGGEVMRRVRSRRQIIGAYRPKPPDLDNTPLPGHKEGVEWCIANGIMLGNAEGDLMLSQPLTRQQFCTMCLRLWRRIEEYTDNYMRR